MKIKHHPGKAVVHDPSWLEMDIPNYARGRQYEANWQDTQNSLSNASSKNSWDKYSAKSLEGTLSAKLGPYQTMLQELSIKTDDIYTLPRKITKDSVRLKYHSQKCLSRINAKSVSDIEEEMKKFQSDQKKVEEEKQLPKPKPRTKLPKKQEEKRKSVRFDEIETEIPDTSNGDEKNEAAKFRVITNPLDQLYEQELSKLCSKELKDSGVDSDEICHERISNWVDEQNQYLENNENVKKSKGGKSGSDLYRNDSGFYETKKVRQRIPPRVYASTSSSSNFSSPKSSLSSERLNDNQNLRGYKTEDVKVKKIAKGNSNVGKNEKNSDFMIPRPKLIVPVHSYGVRRRRTGNLISENAVSECEYDGVENAQEKNEEKEGKRFIPM